MQGTEREQGAGPADGRVPRQGLAPASASLACKPGLQGMARDAASTQALYADVQGFSLHAEVRCAADDGHALAQQCRDITRSTLAATARATAFRPASWSWPGHGAQRRRQPRQQAHHRRAGAAGLRRVGLCSWPVDRCQLPVARRRAARRHGRASTFSGSSPWLPLPGRSCSCSADPPPRRCGRTAPASSNRRRRCCCRGSAASPRRCGCSG